MNFTNKSSGLMSAEPFPPDWAKIVVTVIRSVSFLVGFPGNLSILIVFLKRQRTTTNRIIITQALIDLVFFLIQAPMYYINVYPTLFFQFGSSYFCRLFYGISFLLTICTTILFDFVAFDRFLMITRPHSQTITESSSKYACIGIVLFSTLCATPYLFETSIKSSTRCILGKGIIVNVLPTFRFICSLLSLLLLSGMYFRIFVISYRRRLGRLKSDYRSNQGEASGETRRTLLANRGQPDARMPNIGSENVESSFEDRIDDELKDGKTQTRINECDYEPDLNDITRRTSQSDVSSSNVNETDLTDVSISVKDNDSDYDCQGRSKISHQISTISSGEVFASPSRTASKPRTKKAPRVGKIDSTTKIILVTVFLFILSAVIPSMVAFLFVRFVSGQGLAFFRVLSFLLSNLAIIRTCINPVCYVCLSRIFREEMRNTLRKLCSR